MPVGCDGEHIHEQRGKTSSESLGWQKSEEHGGKGRGQHYVPSDATGGSLSRVWMFCSLMSLQVCCLQQHALRDARTPQPLSSSIVSFHLEEPVSSICDWLMRSSRNLQIKKIRPTLKKTPKAFSLIPSANSRGAGSLTSRAGGSRCRGADKATTTTAILGQNARQLEKNYRIVVCNQKARRRCRHYVRELLVSCGSTVQRDA